MKLRHRKVLLTSVLVGATALAYFMPAAAQEATAEDPEGLKEVTITGTRLRSSGMNAPTPVTVVSAAQLDEVAPGNIAAAIKQLPQFRGNVDATQNNGIGTDAGQSVVNMRGLGANRTLVLLDGRRMVPSTYNGTVDINVLPQSLLLRTDVVTGGASAAYGTDAVAGVVNFILDTNFTGFKASAQGGITGRGDGANKQGELTFGTKIGDRLHVIAAVDYYDNNAITSVRPWMQSWGAVNDPSVTTDNNHYVVAPNVGSSIYTPGGLIRAPGTALNNLQFLPDGTVAPFRLGYGTQLGVQGMSGGDAYDFRRDGALNGGLQSAVTRWNAFSHLSFKITDAVEAWGEAHDRAQRSAEPRLSVSDVHARRVSGDDLRGQRLSAGERSPDHGTEQHPYRSDGRSALVRPVAVEHSGRHHARPAPADQQHGRVRGRPQSGAARRLAVHVLRRARS